MNEEEISKLKRQLEKKSRAQLLEYAKKKFISFENVESLTKEQIISEIIFNIDFREFWRDYYS